MKPEHLALIYAWLWVLSGYLT